MAVSRCVKRSSRWSMNIRWRMMDATDLRRFGPDPAQQAAVGRRRSRNARRTSGKLLLGHGFRDVRRGTRPSLHCSILARCGLAGATGPFSSSIDRMARAGGNRHRNIPRADRGRGRHGCGRRSDSAAAYSISVSRLMRFGEELVSEWRTFASLGNAGQVERRRGRAVSPRTVLSLSRTWPRARWGAKRRVTTIAQMMPMTVQLPRAMAMSKTLVGILNGGQRDDRRGVAREGGGVAAKVPQHVRGERAAPREQRPARG